MKNLYITILTLLAAVLPMAAQVYTPGELVNPNIANRYDFVCDPDRLLGEAVTDSVNRRLYSLRQQTSCEAVVVIVPSIGDEPIEDWCEQLFTRWGIGKKDKDNGVLLLIATEDHKTRIQTGYGVEGVLTDIACNNIIGRDIIPNMRDNNLDGAVNDATATMCAALTDPSVAEELRSEQPDNYQGHITTIDRQVIVQFVEIIVWLMFLLGLGLFCRDLWKSRKLTGHDRAMMWRDHLKTYMLCAIFSLGAGLLLWLLAFWMYRRARTKRLKCPTCGAKMKRLDEEEDNEYLSASQDFEEKLNTVDYDVWACPKCGTLERFPYKTDQKKYTRCPACGTIAMKLKADTVLQKPTRYRDGAGEKIYECEFCHHQDHRRYRIPKRDDEAAALAAGAILGSGLGRGGGGGGGFGGGFGGGATGGGGASGGW